MNFSTTPSCALGYIKGLSDFSDFEKLKILIESKKTELKTTTGIRPIGEAHTSILVVCKGAEKRLRENLVTLGFKSINIFRRRPGYGEDFLELFAINLDEEIEV